MIYFLIGFGWVGFWIYWLAAAAKTGFRDINSRNRQRRLIFLIIFLVILFLFSRLTNLGRLTFAHQPLVRAVGVLIFYAGLILAVWARRNLGGSWAVPMATQKHVQLVTSGPYRFIRHPIYTSLQLMALGSAIALSRVWILILALGLIYAVYSAFQEEQTLTRQLPKEYPAFKKRTKMFIPYII